MHAGPLASLKSRHSARASITQGPPRPCAPSLVQKPLSIQFYNFWL